MSFVWLRWTGTDWVEESAGSGGSGAANHASLTNLLWTNSRHTGARNTFAGFDADDAATEYTESDYLLVDGTRDMVGLRSSTFAANSAVYTNASSELETGSVSSSELGYLNGVTSAVQTQLDAKIDEHSEDQHTALCSDGSGGVQTGPRFLDTSVGKNSYVFPGHYAEFLIMDNDTGVNIEQGDLVRGYALDAATIMRISVRNSSSARGVGVALEDIDAGTSGKVAWAGFCDVKCYSSSTAYPYAVSDCDLVGNYNKVQHTSSGYTAGRTFWKSGTYYYDDGTDLWVRMYIWHESS